MHNFEIGDYVYSNSCDESGNVIDIKYKRDGTYYLVDLEITGETWLDGNDNRV